MFPSRDHVTTDAAHHVAACHNLSEHSPLGFIESLRARNLAPGLLDALPKLERDLFDLCAHRLHETDLDPLRINLRLAAPVVTHALNPLSRYLPDLTTRRRLWPL